MSQAVDIIKYIRDNGSITTRQAMIDLGVYRCASRINEIRKFGIPVQTEMVTVPARDGKTARVARYTIPGGVPPCFEV